MEGQGAGILDTAPWPLTPTGATKMSTIQHNSVKYGEKSKEKDQSLWGKGADKTLFRESQIPADDKCIIAEDTQSCKVNAQTCSVGCLEGR